MISKLSTDYGPVRSVVTASCALLQRCQPTCSRRPASSIVLQRSLPTQCVYDIWWHESSTGTDHEQLFRRFRVVSVKVYVQQCDYGDFLLGRPWARLVNNSAVVMYRDRIAPREHTVSIILSCKTEVFYKLTTLFPYLIDGNGNKWFDISKLFTYFIRMKGGRWGKT